MSVNNLNLESLIDWVGADGAVAALDKGHHTNAELMMLARGNGVLVDSKTPRRQIAIEIVMTRVKRIDKDIEQLSQMSKDELVRYFTDKMASRAEMMSLLQSLQLAPRGKIRGKFIEFVAGEISDLGLYERVSKGRK